MIFGLIATITASALLDTVIVAGTTAVTTAVAYKVVDKICDEHDE